MDKSDIKQSKWEERFDKDFVNIGMVVELCYKEETTYGCDDLCNDKIKQFIRTLLAESENEIRQLKIKLSEYENKAKNIKD